MPAAPLLSTCCCCVLRVPAGVQQHVWPQCSQFAGGHPVWGSAAGVFPGTAAGTQLASTGTAYSPAEGECDGLFLCVMD